MNEEKNTRPSNSKLSTIFLVVLGLHVVVIVLILAYNLLKGDTEGAEEPYFGSVQPSAPFTRSASVDPRPEPRLETGSTEHTQPVEPAAQTPDRSMSMPATSDPIWAMGNVEPRPAQVAEPEVMENASLSEQANRIRQETEAMTAASVPDVRPDASAQTYQVVKGDSLSRIGSRFGVSVAQLSQANGIEGSMIRVGQVLKIPAGGAPVTRMAANTPAPAAIPVATTQTAGINHVVQKGDTLWKIARQYQVNPNELANHNGIQDPRQLKVGSRLSIPGTQQMAQPVQRQNSPKVENTDMAMRAE